MGIDPDLSQRLREADHRVHAGEARQALGRPGPFLSGEVEGLDRADRALAVALLLPQLLHGHGHRHRDHGEDRQAIGATAKPPHQLLDHHHRPRPVLAGHRESAAALSGHITSMTLMPVSSSRARARFSLDGPLRISTVRAKPSRPSGVRGGRRSLSTAMPGLRASVGTRRDCAHEAVWSPLDHLGGDGPLPRFVAHRQLGEDARQGLGVEARLDHALARPHDAADAGGEVVGQGMRRERVLHHGDTLRLSRARPACRRLFTVVTGRPRNVAMSCCEHSCT